MTLHGSEPPSGARGPEGLTGSRLSVAVGSGVRLLLLWVARNDVSTAWQAFEALVPT
jgi:hypothetical protein